MFNYCFFYLVIYLIKESATYIWENSHLSHTCTDSQLEKYVNSIKRNYRHKIVPFSSKFLRIFTIRLLLCVNNDMFATLKILKGVIEYFVSKLIQFRLFVNQLCLNNCLRFCVGYSRHEVNVNTLV